MNTNVHPHPSDTRTIDDALDRFNLIAGEGDGENTACVMTAISWVAGEAWTDSPQCAHRLLRHMAVAANDHTDTTSEQRADLVRAGEHGLIDTWWLPDTVVLGCMALAEGAGPVAKALDTLALIAWWKVDKSRADLSRANLYGADLYRANLYRANLYRADLSGANLYGANLYRADLYRANLYRANLSGANLYRADLYRANLYRANLYRADLSGANLSRANLSRADLYRADLSGANLSRANLSRANADGSTRWPAGFDQGRLA